MPNIILSTKFDASKIVNKTKQIAKELNNVHKEAYDFFKKTTPFNKGYARDNTKLKGKRIHADYQYASILDKGRHMTNRGMRGSTQAPEGMTQPTLEFIEQRVKKITGSKI